MRRFEVLASFAGGLLAALVVSCLLWVGTRDAHAIQPSTHPLLRSGTVTCGTTATPIPTTSIVGRLRVLMFNGDAAAIFLGDSGVTAAGAKKGITVAATSLFAHPFDVSYGSQDGAAGSANSGGTIFCVSAAGTAANAVSWIESR